jgi:hypothetical protein
MAASPDFEWKLPRAAYSKVYLVKWRREHPTYSRDKMREYRARERKANK